MAKNIPPKYFDKLSRDEQLKMCVDKMNEAYNIGDQWKKIRQRIANGEKLVIEEDIRPDEIHLKH